MPRKNAGMVETNAPVDEVEDVDVELVTTAPDDWEFETHTDQVPTHVEFEKPGDAFVGQFIEVRHITPDKGDEFDLLIFKGRDDNPYSITPGYKLEKAFMKGEPKPIQSGTWCRITLVQLVETNAQQPMKDYKVETRSK